MPPFQDGQSNNTKIRSINKHDQMCLGHRGVGSCNHYNQTAYKMRCLKPKCGHVYGANGCDVWQRKCPKCDGGERGIPY